MYAVNVNYVLAAIINLERGFYFSMSGSAAYLAFPFPVSKVVISIITKHC